MAAVVIRSPTGVAELGVANIPGRKSKCLYIVRGAMIEPLAYFRSDDDAARCEQVFEMLVEAFEAHRKEAG